ncbi:MAG TPA: AfsR/SARP family transcriptional regulator [Actinocrinis sp.]|nr:AfsR/SARP family transcriptional regulator [Actinocrinis sp.]
MRIDLMGPVSAHIDGVRIAPSAAKPCQVLALLALNCDRVVSKSTLFYELWAGSPPSSATNTLQTYIHQLRRLIDRALGPDAAYTSRDVLATERGGYALRLYGGDTDVREFQRLAAVGGAAFEAGDLYDASTLLGRALALWRGPFLADIQVGPMLALDTLTLEDLRIAALNRRIEADLHLGRHHEVLAELRGLASENPINENFSAHYMISLYKAGQACIALQEYQRIRNALADELGIEPAPRLRRLQAVILSGGEPLEESGLVGARAGRWAPARPVLAPEAA